MRFERQQLLRALSRPQVVLGLLLLLFAVGYLLGRPPAALPTLPTVELPEEGSQATREEPVQLVLIDERGLEHPEFVTVTAGEGEARLLRATLAALRGKLLPGGVWPASLGSPEVYRFRDDGQVVTVLDFPLEGLPASSVVTERRLLRSIQATAAVNHVERLAFLINGQPASTLLGHLAVPSGR